MKLNGRVIAELVGGLIAITSAFVAYFSGSAGFWIGLFVGGGCILLGAAALSLSTMQEK
ncbi:MAG TPA: hypothetical protein VI282_10865 [Verrucomicrobiae bacterium]|jgi:hypothetical protein